MRTVDLVTVPGTVAGWDTLHQRWGKLSMAEELAPAIALAERGIAVTETDADNWKIYGTPFLNDPEFARVFLPAGKAPVAGPLFRNPAMSRVKPKAAPTPIKTPVIAKSMPCLKTQLRIFVRSAPNAMRIPISCVRWAIEYASTP